MILSRTLFSLLPGFLSLLLFSGCLTALSNSGENPAAADSRTLQDLIDEAEAGDSGVQYYLGWMYENERSEPQSNFEAIRWYRMAAEDGYVEAMFRLGVIHDIGKGIDPDPEEAARWYRRAGDTGHAKSQYNLGMMYDYGEGLEQDRAAAAEWYRRAAEQGYAPAQNNLGVLYANGEGVETDSAEAVAWYRTAAEQSYAQAQYNLGMMYYYGRSVRQSFVEAYAWCYLSMVNGGDPAALRYIVEHISAEEVSRGLRRASELQIEILPPWRPEKTDPEEALSDS